MSFGFSVGDFLAVGTLAWNIYKSCKGMSDEFFEISRDALLIHTLVKELQDEAANPNSVLNVRGASKRQQLIGPVQSLKLVLEELDGIVKKYQGLARREKRIWNQLRLATENLDQIRSKLAFHVTAINAFCESLARNKLVQIENTLLELVKEVHEGRRRPSLRSIAEENDTSGWRELELELAEDGISAADISEHKEAIKVFLLGRLQNPSADSLSFEEVASSMGSVKSRDSPKGLSRAPTISSIGGMSLITLDSGQSFYSALEHSPVTGQPQITARSQRVSFSPFVRLPDDSQNQDENKFDAYGHLQKSMTGNIGASGKRQHRHSFGETLLGAGLMSSLIGGGLTSKHQIQTSDLVLIIDPYHTCMSKLAHAYLRSIVKNDRVVGERIDKVRSTSWHIAEVRAESLAVDSLIKELLTSKRIEVPPPETFTIAHFRLQDILQFDHIVYINCPPFREYLEENLEKLAKLKDREGSQDKQFARLTRFDLPQSLQLPESMKPTWPSDKFRNRQKLALEEIFRAVQRFMLEFLEREYSLRRSSHGFERTETDRPKRSRSLSPFHSKSPSLSSE